jgi:hypothetical protein
MSMKEKFKTEKHTHTYNQSDNIYVFSQGYGWMVGLWRFGGKEDVFVELS